MLSNFWATFRDKAFRCTSVDDMIAKASLSTKLKRVLGPLDLVRRRHVDSVESSPSLVYRMDINLGHVWIGIHDRLWCLRRDRRSGT